MCMSLKDVDAHHTGINRTVHTHLATCGVLKVANSYRPSPVGAISERNRNRLVLLLLCFAAPLACAQIPDAPQARLPLADKILLGTIAAGRAQDAFSTHQFLVAGQDEASLPIWIACSQPNMWTYSAAISTAQFQLSRVLIRRSHVRIARAVEGIHAVYIRNTVVHNEGIIAHNRRVAHTLPNSCLTSDGQAF